MSGAYSPAPEPGFKLCSCGATNWEMTTNCYQCAQPFASQRPKSNVPKGLVWGLAAAFVTGVVPVLFYAIFFIVSLQMHQ